MPDLKLFRNKFLFFSGIAKLLKSIHRLAILTQLLYSVNCLIELFMKTLEITKGEDNSVLRAVSKDVKSFDKKLKKLAKQMREAMVKAKGIGIAAPQVGINLRIFLVTLDIGKKSESCFAMVNPKITKFSEETDIEEEGCLSLPGVYGKVERPSSITVEFFDIEGSRYVLELEGLNARVVQHENDHLDGVLFVDKLV